MNLNEGVLIVLEREDAKAFFGQREDQARLSFVADLLARADVMAKSLNGKWSAIHEALSALEVDESFLQQCVLGGRPLHQGDDHHVFLVRPDVVAIIANQLSQVATPSMPADISAGIEVVAGAYQHAAEKKAAVVFAAKC